MIKTKQNNFMKMLVLIILLLIWITSLTILIIALTVLSPYNPFKEYRLIIGIGFIAVTGFVRIAYRQLIKM